MLKAIKEFLKARRIDSGPTRGSQSQSTLYYATKGGKHAYGSTESEAIYNLKAKLKGAAK